MAKILMSPDIAAILLNRPDITERARAGRLKTIERDGRTLCEVAFNNQFKEKFQKAFKRCVA